MLNGVLERQDTALGLGLVTHVAVLLAHADHHTLVAGATDDGREDGARRVVTGKAGLAHAGTIVHDQGSHFVLHFGRLGWVESNEERAGSISGGQETDAGEKRWRKESGVLAATAPPTEHSKHSRTCSHNTVDFTSGEHKRYKPIPRARSEKQRKQKHSRYPHRQTELEDNKTHEAPKADTPCQPGFEPGFQPEVARTDVVNAIIMCPLLDLGQFGAL